MGVKPHLVEHNGYFFMDGVELTTMLALGAKSGRGIPLGQDGAALRYCEGFTHFSWMRTSAGWSRNHWLLDE